MNQNEILEVVVHHVKGVHIGESSGHDWWHISRVQHLSNQINAHEHGNSFVINMIALLHDLYDEKFTKGNVRQLLVTLLQELNVYNSITKDELDNIIVSVENMSFKGGFAKKKLSLEGQIVQDADRLDAIGAIGIARVFAYGGKKGREIYNPDQGIVTIKSAEEYRELNRHSINHFYEKLLHVKDSMNTNMGKQIAIKRTAFMNDYLAEFYMEWNGKDIVSK